MKKVLVIGATGTMGAHLVPALLQKGYAVDGVTLDNAMSKKANLRYIKTNAHDKAVLQELLKNGYDGVIDFLHYADIEDFKIKSRMFLENVGHYIFLSSYRAYADCKGLLTEDSPRLTEAYADDKWLMREDTYGVRKCRAEDALRESGFKNYTIVRPVVVYGENRYPITTWAENLVAYRAQQGKKLLLPTETKDKGAALIYAGDIAKEFVGVLGNEKAFGQSYTFGAPENLTWGEVAEICKEICGLESEWIPADEFAKMATGNAEPIPAGTKCMLYYDRVFNRQVNVEKVMSHANLQKKDFLSFKEGLRLCYSRFPENYVPNDWEQAQNTYMDEYIKEKGL